MKKNFYLVVLLLLTTIVMHGQNTHYQLPNNNFDLWPEEVTSLPVYWYSFSNTECLLSPSSCDMVIAAGGTDNHHKKVTGYNGTGNACQLYAVERVGRTVNGLITTGRVRLASETLSSPSNYVYTQRSSGAFKWSFAGRPDSISMWARFSFMQNEEPTAMMRVHLHGDVDFRDVTSHTASTAQAGKIANAYCEMTNPATTPVNGVYKSDWKRFAFKFRYWTPNNQPIATPTLENTQQPYYALASISTNKRGQKFGLPENQRSGGHRYQEFLQRPRIPHP